MNKIYKISFSVLLLLSTCISISAQTIYEVSFPNPNTHYIHVDMHFLNLPADSFDVKMPVWIPGSYMVREYSRHVEGFTAYNPDNQPVDFKKVRKNVWRIYNDTTRAMSVSYKVYAYELTVRTCFVDIDHAYINGPALFMYIDEFKDKPLLVNFKPWKGWNSIYTGMPAFGTQKWSRTAENYDHLADCPVVIGNPDVFSFDYQNIPHHVVMVGKANYDKEKIKADFYKIVDECTKIFGDNPNDEYTFMVHNVASRGGGLEHTNSTSVIAGRNVYENDKLYKDFLSLIAHEYIHLWSVKRIRPIELDSIDYENEVYTRQLWFFEGVTSHYDDYLVHRAGFYSAKEYLEIVRNNIQNVLNTPGDKIQSLSESSFDTWIKFYRPHENSKNSTISYYTKGGIVAAVLNIDILHSTNGEKSMDDVLHYLYHEHYLKLGRGVSDEELQKAYEVVAGKSYDDFFNKYIHGTERVPYEEYFLLAGIQLEQVQNKQEPKGYLGATFNQSGSRLLVSFVERGSSAWSQGLNVNDEILSVDDKESMQVGDYLEEKLPGDKVTFRLIRSGLQREFTIILGEPTALEFEIDFVKKPTPEQQLLQSKWLRL